MASRAELFSKLGIQPRIVEPIFEAALELEEEEIWRKNLFSTPHGNPWHTSFHSSSFPGDDPKACGRAALYSLMDIPPAKPLDGGVRLMGEVGKAIEEAIVWRFQRAGILISNSPDEEFQTGYTDKEYWLTCAPDAIIKTANDNPRPHPVEIKGKDPNIIEDMQSGKRSFDPAHRSQVLTQIGLTVENQKDLWPDLEPCTDGTILYVSRARPAETHEFKFGYNSKFMDQGRAKLAEWQAYFVEEKLPSRPKEWKWSESPCQYCPFKKEVCKPDDKDGVTELSKSHGVKWTKEVRGEYSYEETRQIVLDRWNV